MTRRKKIPWQKQKLYVVPIVAFAMTFGVIGMYLSANLAFAQSAQNNGTPSVFGVVASKITAHAITLSWQADSATSFTIKYGTDQQNLSNTSTFTTNDPQPNYTISGLPAGTQIYISITPTNKGVSGQEDISNFKTRPAFTKLPLVAALIASAVVCMLAFKLIRRRLRKNRDADIRAKEDARLATENMKNSPLNQGNAPKPAPQNWQRPSDQQQVAAQGYRLSMPPNYQAPGYGTGVHQGTPGQGDKHP